MKNWSLILNAIVLAWILYFTYLMILITVQYIPVNYDVAFLRIKQDEIMKTHYQLAFFLHVYTSIFVLILGLFQISNWFHNRFTNLHRQIGKFYVGMIILLASPSGLIIGYYANGGILSQLGFMILAILWFYFTLRAFQFAKRRNFEKHRKFMYRSFALTLSAITLRLLKYGIVQLWELPPMDTTRIIAWAGWGINLLVVELIFVFEIYQQQKRQLN